MYTNNNVVKDTPKIRTLLYKQDTAPGPQGVHNRGDPLYMYTNNNVVKDTPKIRTLLYKQDTAPGPQGVHNRGNPLYTRSYIIVM